MCIDVDRCAAQRAFFERRLFPRLTLFFTESERYIYSKIRRALQMKREQYSSSLIMWKIFVECNPRKRIVLHTSTPTSRRRVAATCRSLFFATIERPNDSCFLRITVSSLEAIPLSNLPIQTRVSTTHGKPEKSLVLKVGHVSPHVISWGKHCIILEHYELVFFYTREVK